MKTNIDPVKISEFKCMREPLSLEAVIRESNRCLLCHEAPCSAGCPAGTDPGRFIRQIRFYNYKGAARTIRNNNILGGVCAFICPVEKLCEKECSIKALEDPININGLQRFVVEYGKAFSLEPMKVSSKNMGHVAIIGAGPAGMSCASSLATLDYDVTLYEQEQQAGGIARYYIPAFRLPEETLNDDITNLLSQGVKISHGKNLTYIGTITDLMKRGFDAVFISTGLSKPFRLELLEGYINVTDYLSFLRNIRHDFTAPELKNKNIAIIGGGSVALDAAVSASAAGASRVYLISLEHLKELPADQEEINLARLMNVIFKAGSQITRVVAEDKQITRLTGIETDWKEPDNYHPSNARQIQGTEFSINVDLVVQAIGTCPDDKITRFARGVEIMGKGTIVTGSDFSTNLPGVFAGGDVVSGGATIVQAVGDGKKAAESIHNYLNKRRANQ
ncbi:MAG TPA: hypothetical protein DCR43_04105 [Bacteroidales bacterium]|nr:MAG: hypothetical protein A2X11_01405 [Bacteroidetes bacterium GWE2_42_24]OFY27349.1 MAG: hypothetical protein A2X09_00610 [Bacteroidetes bacterium GWF2_43_11]HAQ65026.1 hypothetical protein [Bacteroidales bacterium]HBZ65900.1 hypothetical protein [Bacteroidales bacterium]